MAHCKGCGKSIGMNEPSCYVRAPGEADMGDTWHSDCYGRVEDLATARRILADFEKRGGTTLEALKRELGL